RSYGAGVQTCALPIFPVAVVRAEDGGIRVGEPAPRERLAAGDLAEASHAFVGPRRLATDRLDEDAVAREEVVALERRRLIRDLRSEERRVGKGCGVGW